IALLRALLATLALLGERQYRALLTRAEHEIRYQKLFLMTTGLKNEVYFMRKNTEEIETVMGNAYRLYEQLSDMENVPPETQKIALSIARDVHEIKKDYIRIIQGLENEMVEQYDESEMSAADLVRILEESTARMIEEHGWSIRLDFAVADDFATKKHYALMAILKNLISNGLEAINAAQRAGTLCLAEQKAGENYRFTVSDTGCGILHKDLDRIFRMGFSTKFDEKSGNIYRGVGLPGVKMTLEEQFGGSITVESVCGEGTMFCIEIPAQRIAVPKAGQNQKG
ncbi:MAG: ATP-binding protein, partial [Pygmaiobacter sp.]